MYTFVVGHVGFKTITVLLNCTEHIDRAQHSNVFVGRSYEEGAYRVPEVIIFWMSKTTQPYTLYAFFIHRNKRVYALEFLLNLSMFVDRW